MEKNSSISSSRKLPIAFISSIILFMVTQAVLVRTDAFWNFCYRYSRLPEDNGLRLASTLWKTAREESKRKLFLIGSSQTREDFDIDYLNTELGKTNIVVYNLGVYGGTPVEMFMLKDAFLKRKPDIIVYVSFVGRFYKAYDEEDFRKIKHYFHPSIIPYFMKHLSMKTFYANRGAFVDSFLGMMIPISKYRESTGRCLFLALRRHLLGEQIEESRKFIYDENKPESYFTEMLATVDKTRFSRTEHTELCEELFPIFAEYIVSAGVKLIVINGPSHPLARELFGPEAYSAYDAFLAQKAREIGFEYLSEDKLPAFPSEDFIDFAHLNSKGRARMSGFLRNYLVQNAD